MFTKKSFSKMFKSAVAYAVASAVAVSALSILASVTNSGFSDSLISVAKADNRFPFIPPLHLQMVSPEIKASLKLTTPVKLGKIRFGSKFRKINYQQFNSKFALVEGDILVLINSILNPDLADTPTGKDVYARWPGGIVPFKIDPNMKNQQRVSDAIKAWEASTPIRFIAANNSHKDFVKFIDTSDGCWSSIGMVGGEQNVNLESGCSTGNAIHEIGHTVGLWHEHSRNDRDSFINVYWNNIIVDKKHNFNKKEDSGFEGDDIGVYDYESIMHYGSYAFSLNGQATILRKDGTTVSGQRNNFTLADIGKIRAMYKNYIHGDCVGINYNSLQLKFVNNRWTIVDSGNHYAFSFDSTQKNEAEDSLNILRKYKITKSCFVGRPGPSMEYLLTIGDIAPQGNLISNEDCIHFNNANVVVQILDNGNHYRIVSDNSIMADFGNKREEAYRAFRVIKDYKLTEQCFVGRPGPSFKYWKR
ncbi:MAG: M12 family metallopeptidase [Oligoflexia bacterium]|nr:M12 family metallopeptidase [Oligoflexia bacterium]